MALSQEDYMRAYVGMTIGCGSVARIPHARVTFYNEEAEKS